MQKTAVAVAHVKRGNGLIKLNGEPAGSPHGKKLGNKAVSQHGNKPNRAEKHANMNSYNERGWQYFPSRHPADGEPAAGYRARYCSVLRSLSMTRAAVSITLLLLAGSPLDLVQPETLRFKVKEPVALLGEQRFQNVDIRIRVKGGGHVSQVYGQLPL